MGTMDTHVRPIGVAQEGPTLLLHSTPQSQLPMIPFVGQMEIWLRGVYSNLSTEGSTGPEAGAESVGSQYRLTIVDWFVSMELRLHSNASWTRRPYLVSLFSTWQPVMQYILIRSSENACSCVYTPGSAY